MTEGVAHLPGVLIAVRLHDPSGGNASSGDTGEGLSRHEDCGSGGSIIHIVNEDIVNQDVHVISGAAGDETYLDSGLVRGGGGDIEVIHPKDTIRVGFDGIRSTIESGGRNTLLHHGPGSAIPNPNLENSTIIAFVITLEMAGEVQIHIRGARGAERRGGDRVTEIVVPVVSTRGGG